MIEEAQELGYSNTAEMISKFNCLRNWFDAGEVEKQLFTGSEDDLLKNALSWAVLESFAFSMEEEVFDFLDEPNYDTIVSIPYCGLQSLLSYESPVAYTVRREGWAADVYDMGGGVASVTGYAPCCGFDYKKCKAGFRAAIRELVKEAERA